MEVYGLTLPSLQQSAARWGKRRRNQAVTLDSDGREAGKAAMRAELRAAKLPNPSALKEDGRVKLIGGPRLLRLPGIHQEA